MQLVQSIVTEIVDTLHNIHLQSVLSHQGRT